MIMKKIINVANGYSFLGEIEVELKTRICKAYPTFTGFYAAPIYAILYNTIGLSKQKEKEEYRVKVGGGKLFIEISACWNKENFREWKKTRSQQ